MRGFYIKTLMVCLLLVFSLVAVGASTQDLLGENLLRTAEELSEWNLWYDVPPNRKEVSLATLAKTGSAAFGSSAVFGWTEEGALYFETESSQDQLGLKMITEVPYDGEELTLVVSAKLDHVVVQGTGLHFAVYYFDGGGTYIGQETPLVLSGTTDSFVEYRRRLNPPAGTRLFRVSVLMVQATGRVTLKQVTVDPPIGKAFDYSGSYPLLHVRPVTSRETSAELVLDGMSPDPHFTFTGFYEVPRMDLSSQKLVSLYLFRGGEYIGLLGTYRPSIQPGEWEAGSILEIGPLEIPKVQLGLSEGLYTIYAKLEGGLWMREVPIGDFRVVNQDGVIRSVPAFVNPVVEPPFSQIGEATVINSSLGPYLEVGSRKNDRISYLFRTQSRGDLLKLTVTYPDDKTRTAEISVIASGFSPAHYHTKTCSLGTGYLTGHQYRVSHQVVTQTIYFYAPSAEFAIVFSTGENDAPAAISQFTIEPVALGEALPAVEYALPWHERRQLGLYWEDPVLGPIYGYPEDTSPEVFKAVLDRHIDYLKRTAQNTVIYPVIWYAGTVYRNSQEYGNYQAGGRSHPNDFHIMMAERYSHEGINFYPMIRNWSLPSVRYLVRNPEEVLSNPDLNYVNSVTYDGRVLTTAGHSTSPMLNFLHPQVKAAFMAMLQRLLDDLGQEESVKGISLFTASHSTHGFGTLEVGYDDYTVKLFAEEMGLELPEPQGPVSDRFRQWYQWLKENHWERWLQWRCQKQTSYYEELAEMVAATREGLKLHIMLREPKTMLDIVDDLTVYYYEHMALDLDTLASNPNIVLTRNQFPIDYRWTLTLGANSPYRAPLIAAERAGTLETIIYRDFDVDWLRPLLGKISGFTMHERYFETPDAAFKHSRLQLPFGWEQEPDWRVTQPKPTGRYALEHYARDLALHDAVFLTRGGYNLGTQGMEDLLLPFAAAFTSLPAEAFETLLEDQGVVVRGLDREGCHWGYAVNSEGEPKEITVQFSGTGFLQQHGLNRGEIFLDDGRITIQLQAWDLLVWSTEEIWPENIVVK